MYKAEKKNRILRIPDEKFDEYKKMGYTIRDENDNVLFEPENVKATADKKITELQKENDKLKAAAKAQSTTGDAGPAETEKKSDAKGSKKTE